MRICYETSIKRLFHIHGGTKSWERTRASPLLLTWTVLPHSDLQENLRTQPWPQHVPAAFTKNPAGAFPHGSSVTGSLFHTSREPSPSRPDPSFLLRPAGPAGSTRGWVNARAGRHLPKTMFSTSLCTHSVPHCMPLSLSKHLELLRGAQMSPWVGMENKGSELAVKGFTSWL